MERRGNRYTRHNELNLSAKPHGAAIDVYFGLGKSDLVEVLPGFNVVQTAENHIDGSEEGYGNALKALLNRLDVHRRKMGLDIDFCTRYLWGSNIVLRV